jgi:cell division protein FtsL
MRLDIRFWRLIMGSVIVTTMALFAVAVVPIYSRNLQLQRFLNRLADQPASLHQPVDLLRVEVVNRASDLRLPVRANQVGIKRSVRRVRIEIVYVVPVNLWVSTVDLHFHPAAGGL